MVVVPADVRYPPVCPGDTYLGFVAAPFAIATAGLGAGCERLLRLGETGQVLRQRTGVLDQLESLSSCLCK